MPANPARTGIVCPSCGKPVGVAENKALSEVMFWCPACNHRWIIEKPETPKR
jgi:DNA-directed RNA polymerase subunit RPC12/RpoP